MSDQYDHLLAGLNDEDPEEPQDAQASGTTSTKDRAAKGDVETRAAGSTRQRGKRSDPAYEQVNAFVRRDLKPTLFFYLKSEGRSLTDLIEEKLEEYVEEQGGPITPKERRKP